MKKKDSWQFFRKPSGKIAYNKLCLRCANKCKQSWRVEIIHCPRFRDWRNPNLLGSKKQAK